MTTACQEKSTIPGRISAQDTPTVKTSARSLMLSPDQIAPSTALQERLSRLRSESMSELDGSPMPSSSLITATDLAMNGTMLVLTGVSLNHGDTLLSSRLVTASKNRWLFGHLMIMACLEKSTTQMRTSVPDMLTARINARNLTLSRDLIAHSTVLQERLSKLLSELM